MCSYTSNKACLPLSAFIFLASLLFAVLFLTPFALSQDLGKPNSSSNLKVDYEIDLFSNFNNDLQLGEIKQGESIEKQLKLINGSLEPIVIYQVVPDCGCIISGFKPTSLNPGDHLTFKVSFDSRSVSGSFSNRLNFVTSSKAILTESVQITGKVNPKIEIFPNSLQFKEPLNEEVKQFKLKINPNLNVAPRVRSLSKNLQVYKVNSKVKLPNNEILYEVKLIKPLLVGEFMGAISVRIKDEYSTVIPVFAYVPERIVVSSQAVSFGILDRNKTYTKQIKFTIKEPTIKPVKRSHLTISSDQSALKATILPVNDNEFTLKLSVDASDLPEEGNLKTVVNIGYLDESTTSIRVYGRLKKQA